MDRKLDEIKGEINHLSTRIDRLYEIVVRREEHIELKQRIEKLEDEFKVLKEKIAA